MCPRQIIFPKAKEEPINGAEPTTTGRPAADDAGGGLLARLRSRNAAKRSVPPLFKDDPS